MSARILAIGCIVLRTAFALQVRIRVMQGGKSTLGFGIILLSGKESCAERTVVIFTLFLNIHSKWRIRVNPECSGDDKYT